MMSENHCDCGCIYLEAECPNCNRQSPQDRIEELEAKLAVAVEALGIAAEWLDDYSAFTGNTYETTKSKTVRVAIAKIKGEQP
jgi:hypothetical protein